MTSYAGYLPLLAILAIVIGLASGQVMTSSSDPQEQKKVDFFSSDFVKSIMDDKNVTFDSRDFCTSRIYGQLNKTEHPIQATQPKFWLATTGVMGCIVAMDIALLPWNAVKQSLREIKAVQWKKADFRSNMRQLASLPRNIARSLVISPLRTFIRLARVGHDAFTAWAFAAFFGVDFKLSHMNRSV